MTEEQNTLRDEIKDLIRPLINCTDPLPFDKVIAVAEAVLNELQNGMQVKITVVHKTNEE